MFQAFRNADPAPQRVKPMPMQVLFQAQQVLTDACADIDHAIMDMAWIGFFYLLRPGEYCKSAENSPIKLKDVTLLLGTRQIDIFSGPLDDIEHATHSSITFDTQKNRERGEVVGHSTSGHPLACPTRALAHRILYLCRHGGTPDTPLCAVRHGRTWTHVTPKLLTATLRAATAALPTLNYHPNDVSARSLRAGGAMALLCGNVDRDTIRLVGRWKSDAMFRYLHAQALPLVNSLAATMLNHGSFTLLPGTNLAPAVQHELVHLIPP